MFRNFPIRTKLVIALLGPLLLLAILALVGIRQNRPRATGPSAAPPSPAWPPAWPR